MRKMKTRKEINARIYEIFDKSDENSVGLSADESVRIDELCWVLGIDRGNFKLRLL